MSLVGMKLMGDYRVSGGDEAYGRLSYLWWG